ncbi:hypothetical protein C8R44DRAFT_436065 [Mycena epipterygia]|nr:hypothetical protein C8R44DRAFT_436065 [Mycena epipterygia]
MHLSRLQFVANLLNYMLLGSLIMQVYTYYRKFRVDETAIRVLVYGVFCLDLAQTIVLTFHGWWALVETWGRPELLGQLPWTAAMVPFMCGLVSAIVQIFYARRIWALSPNNYIRTVSVIIVLTALTQGLGAMSGGIVAIKSAKGFTNATLTEMHAQFLVWLAGSLVTDALITACMTYILSKAKSRTSWSRSETLLTNLINKAVQTGAVTVLCASVELAMFVHFPGYTYHFVPGYTLGKLYTNSLMLNLNMRRRPEAADSSLAISLEARGGTSVYVEQQTVRSHDPLASSHTVEWDNPKSSK